MWCNIFHRYLSYIHVNIQFGIHHVTFRRTFRIPGNPWVHVEVCVRKYFGCANKMGVIVLVTLTEPVIIRHRNWWELHEFMHFMLWFHKPTIGPNNIRQNPHHEYIFTMVSYFLHPSRMLYGNRISSFFSFNEVRSGYKVRSCNATSGRYAVQK